MNRNIFNSAVATSFDDLQNQGKMKVSIHPKTAQGGTRIKLQQVLPINPLIMIPDSQQRQVMSARYFSNSRNPHTYASEFEIGDGIVKTRGKSKKRRINKKMINVLQESKKNSEIDLQMILSSRDNRTKKDFAASLTFPVSRMDVMSPDYKSIGVRSSQSSEGKGTDIKQLDQQIKSKDSLKSINDKIFERTLLKRFPQASFARSFKRRVQQTFSSHVVSPQESPKAAKRNLPDMNSKTSQFTSNLNKSLYKLQLPESIPVSPLSMKESKPN